MIFFLYRYSLIIGVEVLWRLIVKSENEEKINRVKVSRNNIHIFNLFYGWHIAVWKKKSIGDEFKRLLHV